VANKRALRIFPFFFIFFLLLANPAFAKSELEKTTDWLKKNQNLDGSWGGIQQEHFTASAMIALYETGEYNFTSNATYCLKQQIENFSSSVWKAKEADIPAIIIYSFYATENENAIDIASVSDKLMGYQNMSDGTKSYGGFIGFMEDRKTPVENSVDTALSLLALWNYENFAGRKDIAINFLKSLQNEDGSFNLTFKTSSHTLYSLAPDAISLTALASIALNEAGQGNAKAIEFLKSSARSCFGNEGRSYSAALSAIAFDKAGESDYAGAAVNYLKMLQKSDGGFSDYTRTDPSSSNALDTTWAVMALSIENTASDICAPLDVELTAGTDVIQPGETENISLNILGAISSAAMNITYTNSTVAGFPINYSKNVAHYEIIFNDTNHSGTYNVSAQIEPMHGEPVIHICSFEVENETADSTTTTTEQTTTSINTTTSASTTTTAAASGGGSGTTTSAETTITAEETTTTEVAQPSAVTGFASLSLPQVSVLTVALSFITFLIMWKVVLPRTSTKYDYRSR